LLGAVFGIHQKEIWKKRAYGNEKKKFYNSIMLVCLQYPVMLDIASQRRGWRYYLKLHD